MTLGSVWAQIGIGGECWTRFATRRLLLLTGAEPVCSIAVAILSNIVSEMRYFTDLFSPETYKAFSSSDRTVSGFRIRHQKTALRIEPGDILVCYVTRVSRWCGLLEVVEGPYEDSSPVFQAEADPFVVRFKVKPIVWLPIEEAIPIHNDQIWTKLTFTKDLKKDSLRWTGKVRGSLVNLEDADGKALESTLKTQGSKKAHHPLSEEESKRFQSHTIKRQEGTVEVTIPEDSNDQIESGASAAKSERESIKIQALIAEIGAKMGHRIWIPRPDREPVAKCWAAQDGQLLEKLPLNYDDVTLKTIENIDVLWLKGRSIVRAFEVEHTTSIYSGILRMADLLALQPNMDIRLHIVSSDAKREKVFAEIRRPVFSLLEKGPLAESCTYLSYDSIEAISALKHLPHLSDSVLDEYTEEAD